MELEDLRKQIDDITSRIDRISATNSRLFVIACVLFFMAAQPLFVAFVILLSAPAWYAAVFFAVAIVFALLAILMVYLNSRNKKKIASLSDERRDIRLKLGELRRASDKEASAED